MKLTIEQVEEISAHRKAGMTYVQIGELYNCGKSTIQHYTNEKRGIVKPDESDDIKLNNKIMCEDKKLISLAVNINRAKQQIEKLQKGSKITLTRYEGRKTQRVSGEVETKYPDKLLIKNRHGRIEMVTLADLLTMKVVVG